LRAIECLWVKMCPNRSAAKWGTSFLRRDAGLLRPLPAQSPDFAQTLRSRVPLAVGGTGILACALGFPSFRHKPNELEGAPPLVCKGGLLRSDATRLLLFRVSPAFAASCPNLSSRLPTTGGSFEGSLCLFRGSDLQVRHNRPLKQTLPNCHPERSRGIVAGPILTLHNGTITPLPAPGLCSCRFLPARRRKEAGAFGSLLPLVAQAFLFTLRLEGPVL